MDIPTMLGQTESKSFPYNETTNGITVSVLPEPLPDQSSENRSIYAFAYTITIENNSDKTVQLLRRHWFVYSDEEQTAEVEGDGVIGTQPQLRVGEKFTYTSGTVIQKPTGSMFGTFTMQSEEGEEFEIIIPRFDLVWPTMVN